MSINVWQWIKSIQHGTRRLKNNGPKIGGYRFEQLESREMLSGSNAIDRLDFGDLASEASHYFETGETVDQIPAMGTGTVGASTGLTYRKPLGSQDMVFTMAMDPNRQNYISVRLWGNDAPGTNIYLSGNGEPLEEGMGNIEYPNRFLYFTINIPISMTSGKSSLELTLNFGGSGSTYRPIYSAYTHTDPFFVPDSDDPTGTKPILTGQATLDALTETEANNILLANRQNIYNSGGYYDSLINQQIIILNGDGTWSGPSGAPPEVVGLDMFANYQTWMSQNPGATPDQWRNKIANTMAGPGYTAFPDKLLGALTTTYLLEPLKNSGGSVIYSAPRYHDSTLITRIAAAIDGVSYQQDLDGGIIQQGSEWTGLCSTARTTGSYIGTTARQYTYHGGGDLQGADTYALGWSIILLMNDPTAAPILQSYLSQSYDADLNGGSMMRAYAWERLLDNMLTFYQGATGGVVSQHMFQLPSMYAATVALNKLQAIYPNASYTTSYSTSLNYVKELMGLVPDTQMRGVAYDSSSPYTPSPYTNYDLTQKGLGEAHGSLSCGFDGGGYGQHIPWLATRVAQLAAWDDNIDTASFNAIKNMANNTINSFNHFISTLERATVNSSGVLTSDVFSMGQETYITYRDVKNINVASGSFNFNAQYWASDPNGALNNAYAMRSAYLNTQYGVTPSTESYTGNLNYLRDLSAYEATIKSLIGVNPSTLTELPGEPGQPDFAWADPQAGAVAFINHGERFYMNADWRNYEFNGTFGNIVPSQYARIHYTTDTVERGAMIVMPYNSASVQSDGNYTSTSILGVKVVRYGDYLFVLNQSTGYYSAKLPTGVGLAEDLITNNTYPLGSTVAVAPGQSAIFWLDASSVIGPLGTSAAGADVGSAGLAGSNSYADGTYTVSGAGSDIGGTTDAFRFLSTSASGDTTISVQITSQSNTNASAKAGVMIRDGSSADAAYAAVLRTPGNGVLFQWRSSTGGNTAWIAVPTPLSNTWVKLFRSGNDVSAFFSTDGATWTQIGSPQTISLSTAANIGLAVSSHTTTTLSTATFSNVSFTAGLAPTVATAASATLVTSGGNAYKQANLSVLGTDNSGEAGLTYTWHVTGTPPSPVTFSINGTNSAKNTAATFASDGTYNFRVIIKDSGGSITINDISVTVGQILTGVSISPANAGLYSNESKQFIAMAKDQFGMPMTLQPAFTWTVYSGIGTVDSYGLYKAPATGSGSASVRASYGSLYASASVTVTAATTVGVFSRTLAIGSPTLTGSASYNSSASTYTVSCGGSDIWGTSDQFRYVYVPLTGDGVITARVASETNPDGWAKAGVMFRNTLDANSAYAMLFVSPSTANGVAFQYRSSAGASAASNASYTSVTAPYWVRLTRSGDSFKAERSPDGTAWTQVGTDQTIAMNDKIYVGLEACSHNTGALLTATFDNVSVFEIRNTTTGGVASSNLQSSSTETAAKAFDGSTSTKWYGWSNTGWLQYDFGDGIAWPVTQYNLTSANDVPQRDPKDWQFQGSNNGTTWTTLDTRTAQTFAARYQTNQYSFANTTAYRYYRINVTANSGGSSYGLQLSETALIANIQPGTIQGIPTVATPAAASPSSVTGTTTTLSALAADNGGEANLTYTWTLIGSVSGNVTFNRNGTNTAKSVTATFSNAGVYNFLVTIMDSGGLIVCSSVTVTVNQTFTSIAVSPATPSISPLAAKQFTAVAKDQFGKPMATQPGFTWSLVSGSGTIDPATGFYTASATGTTATIRATSGGINGSTTISIVNQKPLLAASVYPIASPNPLTGHTAHLSAIAVDDYGETYLVYTWTVVSKPSGAADPTFSANGINAAKNTIANFTQSGSYTLKVTVTDQAGLSADNNIDIYVTYAPETYTWDGGSTVDNHWSTPENWVGDLAPQAGDSLVFPAGAARLDNVNDYPTGTVFGSIIVSGSGYKITNGGNSTPASIQVQPDVQLETDKIVTGTLTIGAGAKITITPISGGPLAANSSLVPLATNVLPQSSTKPTSQPTIADISTSSISTPSTINDAINRIPSQPNGSAGNSIAWNRIPESRLGNSQAETLIINKIKASTFTSFREDFSLHTDILKNNAVKNIDKNRQAHAVALQKIIENTGQDIALYTAEHIRGQKHARQLEKTIDGVFAEDNENINIILNLEIN